MVKLCQKDKSEEDSNLDSHNLVLRKEHTSFRVYLVVVLYPRVVIVFVIFLAELTVIYSVIQL